MSSDFACVGLGNPGKKYERTRHNLGFLVADALGTRWKISFSSKFSGEFGVGQLGDRKVYLLKPQTFMNVSGQSVGELVRFFKIPTEQIVVIHDDVDQEFGAVKFALNGGDGGHNGIKSIYEHVGKQIWRLKLGVGRPEQGRETADHVLGNFSTEEWKHVSDIQAHSVEALAAFIELGPEKAMNKYHRKRI